MYFIHDNSDIASYAEHNTLFFSAVTVLTKLFKASEIFPKYSLNGLKKMNLKVALINAIYSQVLMNLLQF